MKILFNTLVLLTAFTTSVYADKKIEIVSTLGQITNMVEIIGGTHVNVSGLMGPGVDPHLYKASESDVRKLSNADIIFYNGLHLEAKMGELFEKMSRFKKTVAVSSEIPQDRLLSSETYTDQHDPHIWFDVTLWKYAAEKIAKSLSEFDAANSEYYLKNKDIYLEKLSELHAYILKRTEELDENQRVIITAHDAFRYFGKAYDFKVMGLQGISTASEAGTKDVRELADYIAKNKIKAIFIESSVPERNIKAVQEAVKSRGWDVKIGGELFSDAMGDKGTPEGTYIGMVTHNVDTIITALKGNYE